MATINGIKRVYATVRDELIVVKLLWRGLVKRGPDGTWRLTDKGRLERSKGPHGAPPVPPEP
jgi:hypothetical protein